jgi:hypothetical protein
MSFMFLLSPPLKILLGLSILSKEFSHRANPLTGPRARE